MNNSKNRLLATMTQALTSLAFVLAILLPCTAGYAAEPVKIGIQAIRPKEQMLKQWQPLSDALKQAIPERDFTLVPLANEEMESAVASRQLDFVLTNPAHYILMANRSGLSSPLATLNDVDKGQPMPVFGGVIFCRTEQTKLNTLADIRGKTIAATAANSFGSYQMQAYELSVAGIRLPQDGKVLFTGLPQDKVVAEVMSGRAEIGFVRTGLLEKMAQEGKIDIKQIKIINPQRVSGYSALLSTRLYPNWAFAALPNIDERLARRVTTVLLALEDNAAVTQAIGIRGFVIPADYLPVENMLRALNVPPFEEIPEFTIQDVWQKYRLWILSALIGSLAILSLGIGMLVLNRRLRMSGERLRLATTAGNVGVWDWDIANNVLTWDASMYSLYGIRAEDFCGAYDAWSKTLHPDDRQFTEAEIQAALRGEREYAPEFRIVRTDGAVRNIKADSKTYYNSQGKALRMVGINIDITERKLAVEKLSRSESELKKAQQITHIGSWYLDLATNEVVWTEELYKMYGFNPDLPPPPYTEHQKLFTPESWELLSSSLAHTSETGIPYELELKTVKGEGRNGWMWVRGETIKNAEGKTIGLWGAAQDITERKQTEERFRQLFANMSSGAVVYQAVDEGEDFIFVDINSAVERIERVTRDDLIGKRVTEAFPGIREMGLLETFKRVWQSGQPEHYPLSFYSDNKISGWQENFAYRLTSGELVVIYDDITESKQAERALQASEEKYRFLVEYLPAGIFQRELTGNYLYVSPALVKQFDCATEAEFRERYGEITQRWAHSDRHNAFEELLLKDGYVLGFEVETRLINGETRWFSLYGFLDRTNMIFNGISVDITLLKQAETELKRYKDHLEEEVQARTADLILARDAAEAANKAKSVFLTSINHELRTPLNAILGFSNLLRQDTKLRPEQRTNLDIINRSGEHLLTLINDVLEMAKIEAGKTQLNITPFDFGALVRDVADMMHMRAQEKGLQLLIDQSSEFPRYIKADEARLRQVLINLVGNAIKFTQQGGVSMRFGIKPHDFKHHLLIEIEDSGIGISAEDQQDLFQPFIQMGALPGDNKGTGLGLAITKQFVQLMGGTISVESTPGKGSLFRVELPFSKVDANELSELDSSDQDEVAGLAPGQPVYRILIVEDQLENQLLLTQLMQRIGFEVKVAEDGKQGVQLFQSWQPHLIWMGRRMPVMDGMEATQIIRQLSSGKDVKIVAVTASALSEERDEMLAAGMDDFVRKPYRFNEIYDSLSRQLGVQYRYAETQPAKETPVVALTTEMLTVLPPALHVELKAALESLDSDRIDTLIGQVAAYDENLQKTLLRLVGSFDYPAILKVLNENN